MRDWLHAQTRVKALLLAATHELVSANYCEGGTSELNTRQVVQALSRCWISSDLRGNTNVHLITLARNPPPPGQDREYENNQS